MVRYEAHNADSAHKFQLKETKFSDLTEEEFAARVLTYKPRRQFGETMLGNSEDEVSSTSARVGYEAAALKSPAEIAVARKHSQRARDRTQRRERNRLRGHVEDHGEVDDSGPLGDADPSIPAAFSWRTPPDGYGNVVGVVHDQEDLCASCWAFVTADSIASRIAVINKGDDAPALSVKQLMACDAVDHGCSTGNMYTAYEWIGQYGGISSKADYNAKVPGDRDDDPDAKCDASVKKVYDTPAMCDLAQVAGEEPLYRAIFERGPVAVGINANKLQAYGSGVIMLDDCKPLGRGIESINHAALVVGWGTTDDGVKYWEIKNSYGPEWGDEGFFRLERGRIGEHKFGTCGLLFESVYPVVTKAGDATSTDAPCVKGSVQKQTYYRNETLNPGLGDDDVEDEARIGVAQRRAHRAHGHAHRARKARLGDAASSHLTTHTENVVAAAAALASIAVLVAAVAHRRRARRDAVPESAALLAAEP
jgi:C1A family cysteine protease